MSHRQSIPNGYPNRPGTRILPPSYQPEPIPMINVPGQPYQPVQIPQQYRRPSIAFNNSFRNNRVAPPPTDYNTYSQPNHSFETPSSNVSSYPLIQTSYKQLPIDKNYYNQSYHQQHNQIGVQPNGDIEGENNKPTSCWSKPLCLGLTRLSGGILFGTMIFLAAASISGLVVSVVLYIQDTTDNSQWEILGMVVCAVMLSTVLVTLCIFIYCYKKGHIVNATTTDNNNNQPDKNNSLTSQYNQENDYRHPYNYKRPSVPYGMVQNITPTSINEDIIQVQDKLTNTETTMAPLRPRDFQRGVWNGTNPYGTTQYRPLEPKKKVHRVVQTLPNETDGIPSKQKNQVVDMAPKTIVRLPGNRREHKDEKRSRRVIEQKSQYEVVEEIIRKPKKRRQSEEYIETIELPKKGINKPRFNKVSVTHVKPGDEPELVQDDFNTDHFYQ